MARALRLAAGGLYTSDPNPRVGCVLACEGLVVGEGWHRRAGGPHAERVALSQAGPAARGATAYVTLEPCCHHGKTPPCTDALLASGVARVVAAMVDPNPLVAGQGLDQLRKAGVAVEAGVMEAEARALNPGFVKRMAQGLPYVRCKLAASLDGRTAMASGESRWITSEQARRDVQLLRARSSAVVTGIGTLLADDPSLNVRLGAAELPGIAPGEAVRQPLRVVVDSRLRTPAAARLLSLPGAALIACGDPPPERSAVLEGAGAQVLACPDRAGRVDLESLLRHLARAEVNEVLIEAGPTLAGTFVARGLVDELVLYLAPHLMGDAARGLFHLPGVQRMADRIPLRLTDVRAVGPDWRLTAHIG
jgi:diaminohydroxyphosphoribosylaminopyrimidine deaminase / 5-amino-6-(5-phosphoribosylamino)uracil reductase